TSVSIGPVNPPRKPSFTSCACAPDAASMATAAEAARSARTFDDMENLPENKQDITRPARARQARIGRDRLGTEPVGKEREAASAGRHRVLAAIVVEAAAGLAAEPAALDIFHQPRAGPVLRVRKPVMQHPHDRQAGIETDEV